MKNPGLLIVAYPGMGQEIYVSTFSNYKYLSIYDYDRTKEDWANHYVDEAINALLGPECDVCFVDANKTVIDALMGLEFPFLIFYPGVEKEKVLKTLALIYTKTHSEKTGAAIADVILNHDHRIAELRTYSNAVQMSTGVINEDFVKQLLSMDIPSRKKVISAIKLMKLAPKEKPTEPPAS